MAIAVAVALMAPSTAVAAVPRPYEGPAEVAGSDGPEPTPVAADARQTDEPDAAPPAEGEVDLDAEPGDDVDADGGDDVDAEPVVMPDWRDAPEGEAVARRIRGGVILGSGGLLLVFGSMILGTTDPCRRLAGNGCQVQARTRAALTMGVPGAIAVVSGAVLLGLGLSARRRLRSSLTMGGTAGRHGGGVVLGGRF